jgi:hypothetical protein
VNEEALAHWGTVAPENKIYIYIYIYIYKYSKQLERFVQPRALNYRPGRREIVRENIGPQQNASNKRKIHTNLRTKEKETGLTPSTLRTYELVYLQAQ